MQCNQPSLACTRGTVSPSAKKQNVKLGGLMAMKDSDARQKDPQGFKKVAANSNYQASGKLPAIQPSSVYGHAKDGLDG